jgi:fructose-1,6-bisphosphatase/inositol monophosphatase family enzyme
MRIDMERVGNLMREVAAEEMVPRFCRLRPDEIGEKSPGDFVTVVDLAMERRLGAALMEMLPGSAVVGEEAVASAPHLLETLAGPTAHWVIDPLDGTANFAAGYPLCAVIVSLVASDKVLAGWILDPFANRLVQAELGGGAWSEGERLQVARPAALRDMNGAIYGRRFRESDAFRRLWGRGRGELGHVFNARCVGQEHIGRVRGRVHFGLYTRLNPWDHAAGFLIHAEAGGHMALFDGSVYRPSRTLPGALMAPDRDIWDRLHQALVAPVELQVQN